MLKTLRKEFSNLKSIGTNTFFQQLGPLLIGFRLLKSKNLVDYYVYAEIYGLWGNDISKNRISMSFMDCLKSPDVHMQLLDRKGKAITLTKTIVLSDIERLKVSLHNQFIKFDNEKTIEDIFNIISTYRFDAHIITGSSGAIAHLLEFKYLLCLYYNNIQLCENVLNEIKQESEKWNMEHFTLWLGDFDVWFTRLKNLKTGDVLNSFNEISKDHKISKLNIEEINLK